MFLSQLLCVSLTDSFHTCSDYLLFCLLRAVVAILDSFHFKVTEEHEDSEPPAEQQEEEEDNTMELHDYLRGSTPLYSTPSYPVWSQVLLKRSQFSTCTIAAVET